MAKLKPGDKAPTFSLKEQNGNTVKLTDYKGKKLLLYFYPKANTPGCTTQSFNVRDSLQDLNTKGASAVGISPDEPNRQKKFDEKYNLGFPLLSDKDSIIAKAYGAWGEKSMYGKKYMGIIRSSFLIDEKGKILQSWYKVSPKNTIPQALMELKN